MLGAIERPRNPRPTLRELIRDTGPHEVGTAAVSLIFSASGPLAVVLSAAAIGGLTHSQTATWVFGCFLGNGILTILLTWMYRSPQAYFWTIPGTVLVGDALRHSTFQEVIGAYLVTAVLIFLLGWSGLIGKIMAAIPSTIVMAMVAGIFLRFGIEMVDALVDNPLIAIPMIVAFIGLTLVPRFAKILPPVAIAAVIGTLVVLMSGQFNGSVLSEGIIARPELTGPAFSWSTMVELVIPLAITVVIVQNGQGTAMLAAAGYRQDPNLSAAVCGLWSIPMAFLGTVSTCLTGPTNTILVSGPNKERHYACAIWCGIGAVVIGLFAPAFTSFMLALPAAFIATLAGIAMLTPLRNAFTAAFTGAYSFGALTCLFVTLSGITLFGITAPFWGIVAGCAIAATLDYQESAAKK